LKDPCDPPTSITAPDYENVNYTLRSSSMPVPKLEFTASRGEIECPVTESEIIYTTLPDSRTSITE